MLIIIYKLLAEKFQRIPQTPGHVDLPPTQFSSIHNPHNLWTTCSPISLRPTQFGV